MSYLTCACVFAAEAHSGQKRKSGKKHDYIVHPLRVLGLLQTAGEKDPSVLMAGVLHDVVEDTNKTLKDIQLGFGQQVRDYVAEVTDDKSLAPSERKKLQIKNAPKKSIGASHIKLADKADNCDDLVLNPPEGWTLERIQGYFLWSREVVRAITTTTSVANFLRNKVETIFAGSFIFQGKEYPCIPQGDVEQLLEAYYVSLDKKVMKSQV